MKILFLQECQGTAATSVKTDAMPKDGIWLLSEAHNGHDDDVKALSFA